MSYTLQAFILKKADQNKLTAIYKNAVTIDIGQQLCLIPLTNKLFDDINKQVKSELLENFDCLRENIEAELLKHIENTKIAYVEAEYFGGRGGQVAIIWEGNKRSYLSGPGKNEINNVLKSFGVIAAGKGSDEFDTLSLGRYRKTEQWLHRNE